MMNEHDYYTDSHIPVMMNEVIEYISPRDGGIYVDGTFGAGGHTRSLLESANCRVFAIDRDSHVEVFVNRLREDFGDRFTFLSGKFSQMESLLSEHGITEVDGILLDIGVSSMQIDTPRRGFSFMHDAPLDMRMGSNDKDVIDLINHSEEEELAGIIFKYGDERMSRRIARAIILARSNDPITRTSQLSNIIKKAVGTYNDTINPSTRTFQALRIWVNDELTELSEALNAAENLLTTKGRLVTITFHSGEDSIVKQFINDRSGKNQGVSRHYPEILKKEPIFSLCTRKAVKPTDKEISYNYRARSAKLRVAEKL